jgi:hypothetical protein
MNFLVSIPLCFSLSDDLCTECVEALRTEALFREQLHQIDLLMADTMRTLYLRYRYRTLTNIGTQFKSNKKCKCPIKFPQDF